MTRKRQCGRCQKCTRRPEATGRIPDGGKRPGTVQPPKIRLKNASGRNFRTPDISWDYRAPGTATIIRGLHSEVPEGFQGSFGGYYAFSLPGAGPAQSSPRVSGRRPQIPYWASP